MKLPVCIVDALGLKCPKPSHFLPIFKARSTDDAHALFDQTENAFLAKARLCEVVA